MSLTMWGVMNQPRLAMVAPRLAIWRGVGAQVGYLEGRGEDFALPDGDADDGQPVP